jgi:hypothetical protein
MQGRIDGMGDVRKSAGTGNAEKIFDRLTVLVLNQDLLLNGAHGPLTPEQREVLTTLLKASREAAELLREFVHGKPGEIQY